MYAIDVLGPIDDTKESLELLDIIVCEYAERDGKPPLEFGYSRVTKAACVEVAATHWRVEYKVLIGKSRYAAWIGPQLRQQCLTGPNFCFVKLKHVLAVDGVGGPLYLRSNQLFSRMGHVRIIGQQCHAYAH